MVVMLGPAFAAPAPEMRARDRAFSFHAVQRELVDERVEFVLVDGRRPWLVAIVAREAELFDEEWLAQPLGYRDLPGKGSARVLLHRWAGTRPGLRVGPTPVLRPD